MQQSKIEMIDTDIPPGEKPKPKPQPTKLGKLFGALARRLHVSSPDTDPTINGCNYFTGEVSPEVRDRVGSMGFHALGADDWKMAWRAIGVEPPGELPKGAVFCLEVNGQREDCHSTPSVTSATKTGSHILTQWAFDFAPVAKGEERRVSYAAFIMPKVAHPEAHYSYNTPEQAAAPKKSPRAPGQ